MCILHVFSEESINHSRTRVSPKTATLGNPELMHVQDLDLGGVRYHACRISFYASWPTLNIEATGSMTAPISINCSGACARILEAAVTATNVYVFWGGSSNCYLYTCAYI